MKRIRDMLLSPKNIVTYSFDKAYVVIITFFCMALLLAVPMITNLFCDYGISASNMKAIKEAFKSNEVIDYKIENNKLVKTTLPEGKKARSIVEIDELNVLVVFSPNYRFENEIKNGSNYRYYVIFTVDKVYVSFAAYEVLKFQIADYSDIDTTIDFTRAADDMDQEFWGNIFKIVDQKLDKYRAIYYVLMVLFIIIAASINLFITTLILAICIRFLESSGNWLYVDIYKIALYCSTPYVVLSVLGNLYGLAFLNIIGYLITAIYAFIASRRMTFLRKKEK